MCEGCPDGTSKDGVICRSTVPPGCHGDDIDRDGIPESCDNCPYNFNPNQNDQACVINEGVCPGGVISGVLWSPTSPGIADRKPCPNPLSGQSYRTVQICNDSQHCESLLSCLCSMVICIHFKHYFM